MSERPSLPPRVRRLFRLPTASTDRDVDDEIAAHIAARVEYLIARGRTREQAETEAHARFGSVADIAPQLYRAARERDNHLSFIDRMDTLRFELAQAVRQLRRTPGMSLAIITMVAMGIGASTTMFAVADQLLLSPPPKLQDPDRLRLIAPYRQGRDSTLFQSSFSLPAFEDVRMHTASIASAAAWASAENVPYDRGAGARKISATLVTGRYFTTLGTVPFLGRLLTDADAALPTGVNSAVLSYGFWQRVFGANPNVLGRILPLGHESYEVVGVAPPGFRGLAQIAPDVWLPITASRSFGFMSNFKDWSTRRDASWLSAIARLKSSASVTQLNEQATAAFRAGEAQREKPDRRAEVRGASLRPIEGVKLSSTAKVAALLAVVSLLVFLIGCANTANLLLARAIRARRETAVRLALGVSRRRMAGQAVLEGIMLAGVGGVLGIALGRAGNVLMSKTLLAGLDVPPPFETKRVLLAVILVVGVAILCGILPLLQSRKLHLSAIIREAGRTGSVERSRTRAVLLIGQIAMSVLLLVGTGLFATSLRKLGRIDLGYDTKPVLTISLDVNAANLPLESAVALFQQMEERLRTVPGLASVSTGEGTPLSWQLGREMAIPGRDSFPEPPGGGPNLVNVGRDYFKTAGTDVIVGRTFSDDDFATKSRVVIINRALAKAAWPGKSAIGECVKVGGDSLPCSTVVGVVEDIRRSQMTDEKESFDVYAPFGPDPRFADAFRLFARVANGDPQEYVGRVRAALQTVAPNLPYIDVQPWHNALAEQLRPWELGASMFGVFGALALLLTAFGIYSLISYAVDQRLHEMGIRVALGAQARDVVRLVLGSGLKIAVGGAAIGVALTSALAFLIQPLLYQTSARDPGVTAFTTGVIILVAVLGSAVPTWRALRVDPSTALRSD